MDPVPAEPSSPPVPTPQRAHGRLVLVLGVAAAVVLVDLITKVIVVARLEGEDDVELLGGLLTLNVIRNSGAAFGVGAGFTVVFTLVATAVAFVIVRTARRLRSVPWALALGALLGGALGNLVDRVFRSPGVLEGHVVDFLELPRWPIFNVADAAITCAGVGIVLLSLFNVPLEGSSAGAGPDLHDTGSDAPSADDSAEDLTEDPADG